MTNYHCFGVFSQLILEACLAVFLLAHRQKDTDDQLYLEISRVSLYVSISVHALLSMEDCATPAKMS